MMKFKSIFSRMFLIALVGFFVTSCQSPQIEEALSEHGVQMEETGFEDNNSLCEMEEDELGFDLSMENRIPTPPTFSYAGTLANYTSLHSVPSYMLGQNCLCQLQSFELEFTNLPNSSLLNLYNDSGDPVPFSSPSYKASTQTYTVNVSAANLNMGLFISYNAADPSPALVTAGGLCMIDNVSAPIETALRNRPWRKTYIDPEGNDVVDFYIPVEAASTTHRLVK